LGHSLEPGGAQRHRHCGGLVTTYCYWPQLDHFNNPSNHSLSTLATSCDDLYKAGKTITGVFAIDPDGLGAFQVRCDMTSSPGKGWTIFQRRVSGSVDFYRNWTDYKYGFGSLDGEFWLGLDKIHRLSQSGQNVLRFDLENFEGEKRFAIFEAFGVANETNGYLLFVSNYTGKKIKLFIQF
jgi:ficolin